MDQLFGILGKKVSARVRAAIEGGAKLVDGGEVVQVSKGTPDLSQSEVDQLFGILEGQKARGGAPNARFAAMSGGQIGGGVSVMGGDSGLSTNARAGKGTLQLDASVTGQSANGNYILEIIAPKSIEIPNTGISSLAGGY